MQQESLQIAARLTRAENTALCPKCGGTGMAAEQQEWQRALRIGGEIIDDFPNSKMADDVRKVMVQLRDSAAKAEATGAAE